MIWLLAGIVPAILWAVVNHTDKYLLSKTKNKSSVEVLMIYSTAFSIIFLPILFVVSGDELFVSHQQVGVQIFGGILLTLSIFFYLKALNKDETSVVMPLFLLVPVFGYILSHFFLNEILTSKQIIACLIIVSGSLMLSLEINQEKKIRVKHSVLWLMVLCTFFQATQETLFKAVTIENSLPVSFFWFHVGILVCGLLIVTFNRKALSKFLYSLRHDGRLMVSVNLFSELLSSLAYMIGNYAMLLAPIVLIMTLNSYQPVFVFLIGTILTIIAPHIVKEKITYKHMLHKGISITVILIGTLLIAQSS